MNRTREQTSALRKTAGYESECHTQGRNGALYLAKRAYVQLHEQRGQAGIAPAG